MTEKQKKDLETCIYFMPPIYKDVAITPKDVKMFFEWSDRGMHKDKIPTAKNQMEYYKKSGGKPYLHKSTGFEVLVEGKKWRGIHIHEMYEQGILDCSMPYMIILGAWAISIKRKWWQFWKPLYTFKHDPVPVSVKDFMKKEMFKGHDADIIEKCYQSII